jgi:hypothetical protein
MTIFLGTTAVTTTSLLKDRAYAKLFEIQLNSRNVRPAASYGLWMLRDFTDLCFFFLHVAGILQQHSDMSAGDAQQVAVERHPWLLSIGTLALCGFDCYYRPLSASGGLKSWHPN